MGTANINKGMQLLQSYSNASGQGPWEGCPADVAAEKKAWRERRRMFMEAVHRSLEVESEIDDIRQENERRRSGKRGRFDQYLMRAADAAYAESGGELEKFRELLEQALDDTPSDIRAEVEQDFRNAVVGDVAQGMPLAQRLNDAAEAEIAQRAAKN